MRKDFTIHSSSPYLTYAGGGGGVCSTLSGVLAIPKTGQWGDLPSGPYSGAAYWGKARGRSRDTLRMNGVGGRDESKRGEKEADILWRPMGGKDAERFFDWVLEARAEK